MERQQVHQVYAELEQRKKNGENNIVVSHFSGVPSIVQARQGFSIQQFYQSSHYSSEKLTSLNDKLSTCCDVDPRRFHVVPLSSCHVCKLSINTCSDFLDFVNRFKNNNPLDSNL